MKKKYVYDGKEYGSASEVKQAIFEKTRLAFCAEPEDGKAEFWEEYGVTYTEEPDPEPTLDELKANKLIDVDNAFLQWYERDATVTSSLGFVADSDARAMMDVSGLVTTLEATPEETRSTVAFMDHDNIPHMLTLEQMKTVQLEIIQNGQSAYAQKWAMRTAINEAQTKEELEAIEISFKALDFSEVVEDAS